MKCNNCSQSLIHERLENGYIMHVDEAEYCQYCNETYCDNCIDWQYMNKHSLEKTVCNLCSPDGYEYSFNIGGE